MAELLVTAEAPTPPTSEWSACQGGLTSEHVSVGTGNMRPCACEPRHVHSSVDTYHTGYRGGRLTPLIIGVMEVRADWLDHRPTER